MRDHVGNLGGVKPPSHKEICLDLIYKIEGEMEELGINLSNIPGDPNLLLEERLFGRILDSLQELRSYVKVRDDD